MENIAKKIKEKKDVIVGFVKWELNGKVDPSLLGAGNLQLDEETGWVYCVHGEDAAYGPGCYLYGIDIAHREDVSVPCEFAGAPVVFASLGDYGVKTLDLHCAANLKVLECRRNDLVALDLTACSELIAVDLSGNRIEELDLSGNPLLESLCVSKNRLTSLDVSFCPWLWELQACGNDFSGGLDLTHNHELWKLVIVDGSLPGIDLSGCPNLGWVLLPENPRLTAAGPLDLSCCKSLECVCLGEGGGEVILDGGSLEFKPAREGGERSHSGLL